jgi:hypothetical protein
MKVVRVSLIGRGINVGQAAPGDRIAQKRPQMGL